MKVHPFCIKILEDRLVLEKKWLIQFNNWLDRGHKNSDTNLILMAEENITNCEFRINKLEECINFIKQNNITQSSDKVYPTDQ